jgi:hypothetical protein
MWTTATRQNVWNCSSADKTGRNADLCLLHRGKGFEFVGCNRRALSGKRYENVLIFLLQHSVEADCRYLAGIIHAAGTGTLIKDEQAKIWHVQLAAYIYFRDQLASFMGQRNPATVSLPKDGGRKSGGFYSYDVHVKLSDEEIIEINPGTWGALQRRSYKLAKLSPCKF